MAAIREEIRTEVRLLQSELATDLGRFPVLKTWSTEDLNMVSGLMINAMIGIVEQVLSSRRRGQDDDELIMIAEKQLRLIILGVPQWRSQGD